MKSKYTPEMEQAIEAASPLDLATATVLAEQLGKKPRGVIAKAISMGLPYNAKRPRPRGAGKVELVSAIEKALSAGEGTLVGLEKARRSALDTLLSEIA